MCRNKPDCESDGHCDRELLPFPAEVTLVDEDSRDEDKDQSA